MMIMEVQGKEEKMKKGDEGEDADRKNRDDDDDGGARGGGEDEEGR